MKVHIQSVLATVRFYNDKQGENPYQEKKPFSAVLSLSYLGDRRVHVHSAHGTLTRSMIVELAKELYNQGFKEVSMDRGDELVVFKLEEDVGIKLNQHLMESPFLTVLDFCGNE
jgi:hypothetical protein